MRRKLIILAFALVYLMAAQAALIDDYIRTFPKSVINVMAQRDARYHHYLWHQVRQGWNRFSDSTKDAFRKIGWEPPNPARNFDSNGNSIAVFNNYAGEDFLYMHREMIKRVNKIISDNKEPIGKISGWSKIPGLGDKDWPVPSRYTVTGDSGFTSSITNQKTDNFYTRSIVPGEKLFTDPVQLRKMSLNEFGMRLETTVHTWIHMRWSSSNVVGYRNSYRGTIPYVDPKWDDVRYDWMGDTYCSHVHPLFWKVHGWVDDRLEDWRKANGIGTIRWRGTWTGGPMNNVASVTGVKNSSFRGANAMANAARGSETLSVMDQAFKILQESNFQDMGFGEKVIVPEWKM